MGGWELRVKPQANSAVLNLLESPLLSRSSQTAFRVRQLAHLLPVDLLAHLLSVVLQFVLECSLSAVAQVLCTGSPPRAGDLSPEVSLKVC